MPLAACLWDKPTVGLLSGCLCRCGSRTLHSHCASPESNLGLVEPLSLARPCLGLPTQAHSRLKVIISHGLSVLPISSGHDKGTFGVELWCNLQCPIGYTAAKPIFLQKSHFNVAHQDSRRLLVHVSSPHLAFWVFVAHAPQSGRPRQERQEWWDFTTSILAETIRPHEPLFVCIDANAPPGHRDGQRVFEKGFASASGTQFLKDFMEQFDLCAPATSKKHVGDTATWHAPDGQSEHVIDYVLVPALMFETVTHSQLLQQFDLGNTILDHTPVALEMEWTKSIPVQPEPNSRKLPCFDRRSIATAPLQLPLLQHKVPEWSTDVDSHFTDLRDHFLHCLSKHCPKKRTAAKKPYITPEIWEMRHLKLACRKRLKEQRRLLARETIARALTAWRSHKFHAESVAFEQAQLCMDLSFNFGTSLHCFALQLIARFTHIAKQLKEQLKLTKQKSLNQALEELPSDAHAGTIHQVLKPFIGPSNKLRQGLPPLPAIKDQHGQWCPRSEDTVNRWADYFAGLEGGVRIDTQRQRTEWIDNLAQLSVNDFSFPIEALPSLCELEFSLRKMKAGKASGPDSIPSELCRHFAGPIAKQVYTLMMKSMIQGHEPIDMKGGIAIPIWKGKQKKDVCSAFRSILLSSNIGKAFHKTMRSKQSLVYESYLQHQQLGGRKKVPVVLGTHLAKAFQRTHHKHNHATALLFVDLEAAFYSVVRPLALSGEWDDEILASMAARLHLPADTVHALYHHLQQPGATELAGMSSHEQRALRAFHTDTFFTVPAQTDVVKTHLGTRPGDAYADIVFGFLMARVLHAFQDQLQQHDVLSAFPDVQTPAFFGRTCTAGPTPVPFVGPVWMDDLAVCLWGNTTDAVAAKVGVATGVLLDLFREHAMSPNLARGKTEVIITPKGPKSTAWKKKLYGPLANGYFPVVGESEIYHVPVVASYLHLGSLIHHSGSNRQEAKRRIAIAREESSKLTQMLTFQMTSC